ncbi:MAG: 6-carboxytetrahydropterin synthase [Elusimicrobia bacterium]|nr:6-carboxytetrahydropterin synthase [Elusimicrobiota bacterium]
MYSVTKVLSFCYGHRLLRYQGKCKYLHGHNGRAEIHLRSENLDPRGMVIDFSDIKNLIGRFIEENLDHKILLCREDPLVKILESMKEPHFVMEVNPTAENIAKLIFDFAHSKNLPVISVKLWETDTSFAVYEG